MELEPYLFIKTFSFKSEFASFKKSGTWTLSLRSAWVCTGWATLGTKFEVMPGLGFI